MPQRNGAAWAAFVIVCVVWGTTYLGIRIALETIPAFLLTGLRFTVAGAILLLICRLRGQSFPRQRNAWLNIAFAGALMVGVGNLSVVLAEQWVPSGFAALMVATGPFWMVIFELIRGNMTRLTAQKLAGLILGFAGVVMLVAPHLHGADFNLPFLLGVLAIQVGTIGWNLGSVRAKYHVHDVPPLMSAALQMLVGGVILDVVALVRGETGTVHFTTRTFVALAYLTIFGSVLAYGAYVYALSNLSTTSVSLYAYVNPAIALVAGWLFASELLGWREILGMIVILCGVALVQTQFRTRAATPATDQVTLSS